MKDIEFEELHYLWDGSEDGWILEKHFLPELDRDGYAIINEISNEGLIIDDVELYDRVIDKMIAEGVKIVDRTSKNVE